MAQFSANFLVENNNYWFLLSFTPKYCIEIMKTYSVFPIFGIPRAVVKTICEYMVEKELLTGFLCL